MMKLDTEEMQKVIKEMNRYLEKNTIEELMMIRKKRFYYVVNMTSTQCAQDLMTLDLSQRAYNCLKRAGINTIGQMLECFQDTGEECSKSKLLGLRNLGKGTADEILVKLFFYQFTILPEDRRKEYMNKVLMMNLRAM